MKLALVLQTMSKNDTFNRAKCGAVVDGQALNTEAFRKAGAAGAVAGGIVPRPRGLCLAGPVVLKSEARAAYRSALHDESLTSPIPTQ